jgi:hypothetical protein
MAARSVKSERVIRKGNWRAPQTEPSPFPLLVLALILALILVARLWVHEKNAPFAMRTALPEMVQ